MYPREPRLVKTRDQECGVSGQSPVVHSTKSLHRFTEKTTMSLQEQHRRLVQSLYRQSLRMTKSWINRRDLWREKALEVRAQFDENRGLTDKYQVDYLVKRTSDLLAKYKHPDPIIPAQRPDGTKFERNIPTEPLLYRYRDGDSTL